MREDFAGVEVATESATRSSPCRTRTWPDAELLLPISYVFETRELPAQGLLRAGRRASGAAGGRGLERDLHLLPQHDALLRQHVGRAARARRAFVPGRGGRQAVAVGPSVAVRGGGGRPGRSLAAASRRRGAVGSGWRARRRGSGERRSARARSRTASASCAGISRRATSSRSASGARPATAARASTSTTRASCPTSRRGARSWRRGPEAAGEVTRAEQVNRVCARCHQVLFSRYPFTWEGGQRRHEPGRQLDHLGRGARLPAGRLRASDVMRHLPRPARRRSSAASSNAWARWRAIGSASAAMASTRRRRRWRRTRITIRTARGRAASACHMPRKNMGLGYTLTRYHRIGSPDDPVRVERDRPLECALCHADKTVADLAGDHGALVGQALRPGRAASSSTARSTPARSRRPSRAARRTSRRWRSRRWGGGAAGRAARRWRASSSIRSRWCAITPAGAGGAARAMRRRSRPRDDGDRRRGARCVPEAFPRSRPARRRDERRPPEPPTKTDPGGDA